MDDWQRILLVLGVLIFVSGIFLLRGLEKNKENKTVLKILKSLGKKLGLKYTHEKAFSPRTVDSLMYTYSRAGFIHGKYNDVYTRLFTEARDRNRAISFLSNY